MIQPIRVYPVGTKAIDSSPTGNKITLSPQMKRKLQPFPETGSLIHLNKVNTGTFTPVIKQKLLKNRDSDQEIDFTPTQLKNFSGDQNKIKFLNTKNTQSESFSPSKRIINENPTKLIFKTQQSKQEEQIRKKFLKPNQGEVIALTKRSPTPKSIKSNIQIQEKSEIIKIFNDSQQDRNRISKSEFLSNRKQIKNNIEFNIKQTKNQKNEKIEVSTNKSHKFFPERSPSFQNQEKLQNSGTGQMGQHGRSLSNPIFSNKEVIQEEDSGLNIVKFIVQKSQAGLTYNKQSKINQDIIFCQQNFNGFKNRYFMGVCDGHGTSGHYVAQTVKKILPANLESSMKLHLLNNIDLGQKDEPQIVRALMQSFSKTSKEIANCGVDVTFSGSTCVTVLICGPHMWCANIGDSRAVIFFIRDGVWTIQPLSNDHKPDLPSEKKRILQFKGRVEPFYGPNGDPIGPSRVWLQNEQIPGLAMSRSFGDYIASTAGVVSEPEITYFKAEFQKGFIVIASDGVWEFLTNDKVCNYIQTIVNDCSQVTSNEVQLIASTLVKESIKQWQIEDDVIDDISCLVAYLNLG